MKKLLFFIFYFLFFIFCSNSQNLIINPSFEDTTQCPNTGGQISYAPNWVSANGATPDLFNACANQTTTGVGIPNTGFGYQYPRTGNGFAGFWVNCGLTTCREYIQAELTDTLVEDKEYCLTFFVNLFNYRFAAISQVGAYFSSTPIFSSTTLNLPYIPQIINPQGSYLTDTVNWMKISGTYKAIGGEKHITIGCFNDNSTLDSIYYGLLGEIGSSYYFIDDVSLQLCDTTNPFDETNIANVFTPNNDGINEQWVLNNLPEKTQVQIYNRWGVLVAGIAPPFTIQGTYKWDGRTTSGIPCVERTYFYLISTPEKTYKGFVQLVR
jgi:gliding motility-associated-like protein